MKSKKIIQLGNIITDQMKTTRNNPQRRRVYSVLGISPTVYAYEGGNLQPFLLEVRKIG